MAAGARVEPALEILGDDVPDHLKAAGVCGSRTSRRAWRSWVSHNPQPPRRRGGRPDRRLLATADKRAVELGIPNTEAGLSADLLDDGD